MEIVKFYRGERGNADGCTLEEMMQFTLGELEMDHDYIQWMFPSNEPSGMNCDALTLTKEESEIFQADPELKEKVKDSFVKILDFLGFRIANESGGIHIEALLPTEKRPKPLKWLEAFNHNMFRVTRILKALRLTGLTEYAIAFYDTLRWYKDKVSENTFDYWTRAVTEDLWEYSSLKAIEGIDKLFEDEETTKEKLEQYKEELLSLEWLQGRRFIFSEETGIYGQREYVLLLPRSEDIEFANKVLNDVVSIAIMGKSTDDLANLILSREDFYFKISTSNPDLFCEFIERINPQIKSERIGKVLNVYMLLFKHMVKD